MDIGAGAVVSVAIRYLFVYLCNQKVPLANGRRGRSRGIDEEKEGFNILDCDFQTIRKEKKKKI